MGDEVEVGEVIADIETDKAMMGFEIQDSGYIAKLLVEEGTQEVPVGKVLRNSILPALSITIGTSSWRLSSRIRTQ